MYLQLLFLFVVFAQKAHARDEVTVSLFPESRSLTSGAEKIIGMRAFDGRRFECRLAIPTVQKVLGEKQICIISTQNQHDYWQYEVCIGHNISQIHMDRGIVQIRIGVGKFNSSTVTTQTYVGGSGGRRAEVVYQCDQDALRPRIVRVEEPRALMYKIHVATKSVCAIEQIPAIENLPCVERLLDQWNTRVCPHKSVTFTKAPVGAQAVETITFNLLTDRKVLAGRHYEMYNSTVPCKRYPGLVQRARVTYICSAMQRWPALLSVERTECESFVRVGVASACEISHKKMECDSVNHDD